MSIPFTPLCSSQFDIPFLEHQVLRQGSCRFQQSVYRLYRRTCTIILHRCSTCGSTVGHVHLEPNTAATMHMSIVILMEHQNVHGAIMLHYA